MTGCDWASSKALFAKCVGASQQTGSWFTIMNIAIITAPRVTNYLRLSVDSYPNNVNLTVRAEPGSIQAISKPAKWMFNVKKLGVVENWIHTLSYMVNHYPNERVTICEDDIQWSSFDKFEEACEDKEYRHKILSPYCSKANGIIGKEGWQVPAFNHGLCGALCISIPYPLALDLMSRLSEFRSIGKERYLDLAIGQFFGAENIRVHMPTLVFHIGEVSSIGNHELGKEYPTRLPFLGVK